MSSLSCRAVRNITKSIKYLQNETEHECIRSNGVLEKSSNKKQYVSSWTDRGIQPHRVVRAEQSLRIKCSILHFAEHSASSNIFYIHRTIKRATMYECTFGARMVLLLCATPSCISSRMCIEWNGRKWKIKWKMEQFRFSIREQNAFATANVIHLRCQECVRFFRLSLSLSLSSFFLLSKRNGSILVKVRC